MQKKNQTNKYCKGFKVYNPYATDIVNGLKTWEVRNTKIPSTVKINQKIYVCLTYPKTSTLKHKPKLILGSVEITGQKQVDMNILKKNKEKHRIFDLDTNPIIQRYIANGDTMFAWEYKNPVKFSKLVLFENNRGSQTWINLKQITQNRIIKEESDLYYSKFEFN